MGQEGSGVLQFNWKIHTRVFAGFILIHLAHFSLGATNTGDVAAINKLYAALGAPPLPGWVPAAGDPCSDAWQGVQCENADIVSMSLNNNQLTGEIPDAFQGLTSLRFVQQQFEWPTATIPRKSVFSNYPNNQLSGTLAVLQDLPLREL
ncbi:hypothetical protein RJ639_013619 [Escallonia herrerae]|uniref:Leucine-rich repeat-containing N-terminal plant-type domain-containing protein n=1 Tax=Escallonia herrerae TaxID=1293975 RepID=A0AA89ALN9_9ASTE|nr:hypothetical protein RJ639_013619 [Escallonia herrerae]